jgi:hypothetical protein
MTIKEVITELRALNKPYHSAEMKQPYYSQMLKNIEAGMCKPVTVKKFLAKFGYETSTEEQWRKL